jgi:hypothetical protein
VKHAPSWGYLAVEEGGICERSGRTRINGLFEKTWGSGNIFKGCGDEDEDEDEEGRRRERERGCGMKLKGCWQKWTHSRMISSEASVCCASSRGVGGGSRDVFAACTHTQEYSSESKEKRRESEDKAKRREEKIKKREENRREGQEKRREGQEKRRRPREETRQDERTA